MTPDEPPWTPDPDVPRAVPLDPYLSIRKQLEGMVAALNQMAMAIHSIARTMEIDLQKRYPEKTAPRDVTISYIPTAEERLREEQGQTGEPTLTDWTSIGWREQNVIRREEEAEAERRRVARRNPRPLPGETGD
jgi:hypothetical protein